MAGQYLHFEHVEVICKCGNRVVVSVNTDTRGSPCSSFVRCERCGRRIEVAVWCTAYKDEHNRRRKDLFNVYSYDNIVAIGGEKRVYIFHNIKELLEILRKELSDMEIKCVHIYRSPNDPGPTFWED